MRGRTPLQVLQTFDAYQTVKRLKCYMLTVKTRPGVVLLAERRVPHDGERYIPVPAVFPRGSVLLRFG